FLFFFRAEDGIRDFHVTGVQTCALPILVNNVRPVEKPEDVSGVKYRVMQNPVFIGMFSSLGGNAVPMAWGETYTAVQQGAIDGRSEERRVGRGGRIWWGVGA